MSERDVVGLEVCLERGQYLVGGGVEWRDADTDESGVFGLTPTRLRVRDPKVNVRVQPNKTRVRPGDIIIFRVQIGEQLDGRSFNPEKMTVRMQVRFRGRWQAIRGVSKRTNALERAVIRLQYNGPSNVRVRAVATRDGYRPGRSKPIVLKRIR